MVQMACNTEYHTDRLAGLTEWTLTSLKTLYGLYTGSIHKASAHKKFLDSSHLTCDFIFWTIFVYKSDSSDEFPRALLDNHATKKLIEQ